MMKEVSVEKIEEAAKAILSGEIVVFPTETAYGLGVDATNEEALEKLYAFKQRRTSKPTHICVPSIESADQYAEVDDRAVLLAEKFLPGPLTLIMPTRGVLPKILEESGGSERAIRIPDHPAIAKLMQLTGVPITATSANRADYKTPYSIEEVTEGFGDDMNGIAVVLDAGELPRVEASTMVSLMGEEPEIVREGPITLKEIEDVLKG